MAVSYCDGKRSTFTEAKGYQFDNLVEMFELSATDAKNIQRWKELKALSNRNTNEENEYKTLTTTLAQKIITAEDWNKLCDCIINLQQMYIDKGLDQIYNTVDTYVLEYAQNNINEQLDTMINNLLLTNATQVIISPTQPAVVNGALWIKPKTT